MKLHTDKVGVWEKVHHSKGSGFRLHTYMCIKCGNETRGYMKPFRCHKCKGKMERID